MCHFKMNQSIYIQQNQITPSFGKFRWRVLDNQFVEFTDTADVGTLSIYHSCFVLSITIFNDALF